MNKPFVSTTMEAKSATPIDFAQRAAALRDLIEQETANPANAKCTPTAVVEAARDEGLFWLLVPEKFGGSDASLVNFAKAMEELSSADSSVGWTIAAQSIGTMVAGNFCSEEHTERMFSGAKMPIMTATYAPSGRATYEDGTYRGSGTYSFGSGIDHADWVSSALVVMDGDKPMLQEDGKPKIVGAFLPREKVNVTGNWNVPGMQATGSYDYELPETVIHESWTFNQYWTEPTQTSRAASVGTLMAVCAGHVAVALGIARRSLHEAARAANAKKRLYATNALSDTPTFKIDFVRHEALYEAARALAYQLLEAADAKIAAGGKLDETEQQRIRQMTTWVHQVCRDVGVYAYGSVSSSLRLPSILAKNVMDAAVAAQHYIVNDMSMIDAAPFVIERWADESAKSVVS
ncbi:hypothetical protein G6N82_06030 [Altererythrobacter sp. BO-6]|uniref:acyl-CoA dehydrogenase family protein n=1 Tax=Altererythrobacter sp. BO-6 TaxID=2604537 RepID=UPI0013E11479|nr:acyl-CoA dehydrogenase family protein [Altererythrobacter sp. BO-6]QIG53772.1 hypothetical protein G6N82_06030 [Altererythrobacter sp. BO-6]